MSASSTKGGATSHANSLSTNVMSPKPQNEDKIASPKVSFPTGNDHEGNYFYSKHNTLLGSGANQLLAIYAHTHHLS